MPPSNTTMYSWDRRALEWLAARSPIFSAIALMFTALVLLLLSNVVGSFRYHSPALDKEVGFGQAVNWPWAYVLVAPGALFFCLSALRSIPITIGRLAETRMIRKGRDQVPVASAEILTLWDKNMRLASRWFVVLVGIGVVECLVEWWFTSGAPLLRGSVPAEGEYDWSTAAMSASLGGRLSNAAFSLAVYVLLQGTMIAIVVGFIVVTAAFWKFLQEPGEFRFWPDLKSEDDRRGFEAFEETAEHFLSTAAFAYVVFFLSRSWNAFLHSEKSKFQTVTDFMLRDICAGFSTGSMKEAFRTLAATLSDPCNFSFSDEWVTIGAIAMLGMSIATLLITLRVVARRAQQDALRATEKMKVDGESGTTVRRRLMEMRFWPIHYPRPNQLLIGGVIAAVGIYFVRFGLVYVGLFLLFVCRKFLRFLQEKK